MNNNTHLKKEYITVYNGCGFSYGGNQGWLEKKALTGYGCGLVAGNDLILYLKDDRNLPDLKSYKERIKREKRHYPIINHFGISGILLAPAINLSMIINRLPYHVRWGVLPKNLRCTCEEMLKNDIPVIFSVCQVLHVLWKPKGLQLYGKRPDGQLYPRARVYAHYMTLTALDGDEMTISSWGDKYYAKWSEYENLVRRRSFWLFSNIVKVTKK